MQLSRDNQVLTVILPYHRTNDWDMLNRIRAGERPSHPIDASKSQLLEDQVWNAITTGWRVEPIQRCELSAIYHTLVPPSQQEVQNPEPGNLYTQSDHTILPPSKWEVQNPKQGDLNAQNNHTLLPPSQRKLPVTTKVGVRNPEAG